MPQFFEVTSPNGDSYVVGPFPIEKEAEACRAAIIADKPDHVVGEIFSETQNYINSLPKPCARFVRADGQEEEFWTDGTSRTISAE